MTGLSRMTYIIITFYDVITIDNNHKNYWPVITHLLTFGRHFEGQKLITNLQSNRDQSTMPSIQSHLKTKIL